MSPVDPLQGTNRFHSFAADKRLLLKGSFPANIRAVRSDVIFFFTVHPYLLQ